MDRSGSMAGEKIEQARQAALQVLEGLEDGERFNLIVYHEAVESFAPRPVEVTRDSVREARGFLSRVRVSGGTNIHGALKAAVAQETHAGFVPIVLFLTDGLPTVGETSEALIRGEIAESNKSKRRIFTFGVGTDVNTPLLSRLADDSRATASFVLPREAVELKVAAVFRRLAGPVLERPVLSTLRRDGSVAAGRTSDMIPAQLPDLFESDQLTVAGRYHGKGALRLRLEGKDGGETRVFSFEFRPGRGAQPFVPRLWATRKIAVLTDALRDLGANGVPVNPNDPRARELVSEIIRLSTEHGVLSDYTAFLARDGMVFQPAARQEAAADHALYSRAVGERSGAGAVSQETNVWRQKEAARANPSNTYLNSQLVEERVEGVQQVADKAFYRRNQEWVDAVVIQQGGGDDAVPVAIGSKEFADLVDRLVVENRQSCLALGPNLRVQAGGRNYLIR
jgi:Ca-activated chloride channel family protein